MNIIILWFILVLLLLQPVRELICEPIMLRNVSMHTTEFPKFVSHGKYYDFDQFPYLVKLSNVDTTSPFHFQYRQCSGSLLSKTFILSAAHCVLDYTHADINKIQIYFKGYFTMGEADIHINHKNTIYYAKNMYVHPDYYEKDNASDVGIIELETPIEEAKTFARIGGHPNDFINGKRKNCTVIGFGLVHNHKNLSSNPPEELRGNMANIMVYHLSDKCLDNNKNVMKEEKYLCSEINKRGTCSGDSGGPMICNGCQYGICSKHFTFSSFDEKTENCGSLHKQNYHVFVYYFKDWIANITGITEYCVENPDQSKPKKKMKKKKNCGIIPNHELYYVMIIFVTIYNVFF